MKPILDKRTFGPWALVTGSSSGIGREIARHVAASGINVVLVARRAARLEEVGRALASDLGVAYQTVEADLSRHRSSLTSRGRPPISTSVCSWATPASRAPVSCGRSIGTTSQRPST